MKQHRLALTFAIGLTAVTILPVQAATSCEQLTALKLADTLITTARSNDTGTFTPPTGRAGPLEKLPAYCTLTGTIKPTPTSAIQFEVWLPERSWNGKLQVVGNGGLAGTISYPAMADALRDGFATASTDTGHTTSEPASWLQDRERVIDYSSRALHLTTVNAKAVVQQYYSQPAKYAYYSGCSTGGKMGLMEAQRYPDDFDGILAGAAANFWTHQMASHVWIGIATGSPDTNLSAEKLQFVQDRAVAACDMLDGAADHLVSNPTLCRFDPGTLQCAGADSPRCLTPPQVEAVRKIYGGPKNPLTGKKLLAGMYPSGEMGWATGPMINPTTVAGISSQPFWSYSVFHDPKWQFRTLDFARDVERADSELGAIMNAVDPNLEPFRRLNHKLIYYHGTADPVIPAQNGVDYFDTVVSAQNGLERTQSFYRAFFVPGMYHCGGGPGPIAFGTSAEPPESQRDADHDIMKALERWVETGMPPAKVIATKYVDGDAAKGVEFQRPLCPHPLVAMYRGTGDLKDASNFSCVAPR